MAITIKTDQLVQELDVLAGFSDAPAPAVTRIVFTQKDLEARHFVKTLADTAGLITTVDAVGNMFFRWRGKAETDSTAVATGSHIDAIPHSGRYDGTVGVLGGLEAIRALQRSGYQPYRAIDLILFTSEEPTRFGIGCLGSRLMAGALDGTAGERLKDPQGQTLDQVRQQAGFSGQLKHVQLKQKYRAFVELHIEQGSRLEQSGTPLGIVTAIAAPASLRMDITGEGGHAGAVLMHDRHDAFLAAAELALAAEAAAKSSGAPDTVATVGTCRVFPGASNSIPSRVQIDLDVRDIDGPRRDGALRAIGKALQEIAARRKVGITTETLNIDAPAMCDPKVVEALSRACDNAGLTHEKMVSRAYHDSLFMSRKVPTAMLFIPCRGGVSHRPDEYASPAALEQGTLTLAYALKDLSSP